MKVFVTGGSGFVGGHVLEALAAEHEVLAMARSDRSAAIVAGHGATPVRCSLDDVDARHLAGVDAVVHAAAFVEESGARDAYFRANVGGTEAVLAAARAAGVRRFVHISTNATVHDGAGQLGVDETAPYTTLGWFHYGTSKAEAERRVLAASGDGFTTVALRPCFVWGPRDTTILPVLRRMHEDGGFVWVNGGRTRVSTTHVHNLVAGVRAALVRGEGAYFIADDGETTTRAFMTGLAEGAGFVPSGPSLPGALVRGAALVVESGARAFGRNPPLTRMAAMLMAADMTVDTSRAKAELGWVPVVGRDDGLAALAA